MSERLYTPEEELAGLMLGVAEKLGRDEDAAAEIGAYILDALELKRAQSEGMLFFYLKMAWESQRDLLLLCKANKRPPDYTGIIREIDKTIKALGGMEIARYMEPFIED